MKKQSHKAFLKIIVIVILIIVCLLPNISFKILQPKTYIGEDSLHIIRRNLIIINIHSLFIILFFAAIIIWRIYRAINNHRHYKFMKQEFPNHKKYKRDIGTNFVTAFGIFILVISIYQSSGLYCPDYMTSKSKPIFISNYNLLLETNKDIKNNETIKNEYYNISCEIDYYQKKSINKYHRGKARTYKKCFYYISCENDNNEKVKYPISKADYFDISQQIKSVSSKHTRDKINIPTYKVSIQSYKNSNIIKNIEFKTLDDFSESEIEKFFPKVEVTMDENYILTRPENMDKYGDIAWEVKLDGEVIKPYDNSIEPYTITASHYVITDFLQDKKNFKQEGTYEITLLKVFNYPDEQDKYTIFETIPISNTITYTIPSDDSN